VGVGVIAVFVATGKLAAVKLPWNIIMVLATGLATLLMLLLMITGPDKSGVDFGRALGLWLAFISTIASFVGALMNFTGSGGDLKDLTDFKKIKGSFEQDS
jgi:hypothetical protein